MTSNGLNDEATLLTQDLANPYADFESDVDNGTSTDSQLPCPSEAGIMSRREIVLLNLSYLGINLMFLILSVEILPGQVQALVGSAIKGRVLGGMVAGGAVLTFLTGPIIGMQSDRLTTRYGRRRPIMIISCLVLSFGLMGMAFSAPKVNIPDPDNLANDTDSEGMCIENLEVKRCILYYDNLTMHTLVGEDAHLLEVVNWKEDKEQSAPLGAGNLVMFIIFYLLVTTAYVSTVTPYNALIADKSHPHQRGLNSGVMGGMILGGNIGGAALGLLIKPFGVIWIYVVINIILLLCVTITVISVSEAPSKGRQVPLSCKDTLIGFWIPLKDPDFRWVFITRFLMQQGLTTTIGFLEYWIGDMIHLPHCWNPIKGVSIILIPMLVSAAVSSVVIGILSDRIGRRKPLVVAASVTMGIVTGILAFLQGQYAYYFTVILGIIFGIAFGGYQAVDFALLMDVLPNENEKSRDIAVWQQALVLPQALAIPIGGVIIDVFERVNCHIGLGYIIMFVLTSVYFSLSGIFVNRIKKAK